MSGTVAARRSVAPEFPKLGGTLAAVHTDEGRRVRKGDLLAELDPASARQTYEAARAALEQAQDAYASMEQLHDAQSLPEIKWIEIRTVCGRPSRPANWHARISTIAGCWLRSTG